MAVDKKQILMESIEKLLSLNIPDDEIIINLRDVGVTEQEAKRLLEEAKFDRGGKDKAKPEVKKNEERDEKKEEDAEIDVGKGLLGVALDKIGGETDEEKPEKRELELSVLEEKPKPVDVEEAPSKEPPPSLGEKKEEGIKFDKPKEVPEVKTNISELWEKGILATVDTKLEEMQKIKKDLDGHINKAVREQVDKEMKKVRVLWDSQKTLINSKIDSNLEKRGEELKEMVSHKLAELSKIHEEIQEATNSLKALQAGNEEQAKKINEKLEELEKTKSRLISEMNSALIESQSKSQEYLDEVKKKVNEIDARINRTLELESKITEGLIEDAKAKVDKLALQKNEELEQQMKGKLAELEAMTAKVDPAKIQQKIDELDEWKAAMGKKSKSLIAEMFELQKGSYEKRLEEQLAENEKRLKRSVTHHNKEINELVKANEERLQKREAEFSKRIGVIEKRFADLDRKLKQSLNFSRKELEELDKVIDVDKIKNAMEDLDLFKEQFVKVIEKNVTEFNMAKKAMTEQMQARDRAITEHIKRINEKMAELTAFEKRFAEEIGIMIEKMPAETEKNVEKKKAEEKKSKKKAPRSKKK